MRYIFFLFKIQLNSDMPDLEEVDATSCASASSKSSSQQVADTAKPSYIEVKVVHIDNPGRIYMQVVDPGNELEK